MYGFLIFLLTHWCNPELNQENRLPMRTSFEADSKTLSLDGEWKFNGCLNPDSRQKGFHETDFDDSAWGNMPVPGMWDNIAGGSSGQMPVGIIGGFGNALEDIVRPIFEENGIRIRAFIPSPIEELIRYHGQPAPVSGK